jgi:hypothetical protein
MEVHEVKEVEEVKEKQIPPFGRDDIPRGSTPLGRESSGVGFPRFDRDDIAFVRLGDPPPPA